MKRIRRRNDAAAGPLVVSEANPRYFAVASGDGAVVYLTGSHIWNNFHDGMGPGSGCADTPEQFDCDAYLGFLQDHGHNFIRLWRWEQFKSQAAGGDFHLCMTPQPRARPGREKHRTASRSSTSTSSIRRFSTRSVTASSPQAPEESTSR
jgi:hypothetical protein